MFKKTIQKLDALYQQGITPGISYSLFSLESKYTHIGGLKQTNPTEIRLKQDELPLYDIASLTKVIATTTRILQLAETGKLKLTDFVHTYLPKFRHPNVTISQLLTHTSGLSKNIPNYTIETPNDVKNYCYDTPLISKPGTMVTYADANFLLLGFIIEKLDGDFRKSIQKNLLDPLNMQNTHFSPVSASKAVPTEITSERGLIQGEVHDYKAWRYGGAAGHAGLFSTLTDLERFVHCLLIEKGKPLFKNASWQAAISNKQTIQSAKSRAFGWDLVTNNDHYASYHTGFTGPFIIIDFVNQTSLIVLTNRVHPTRQNPSFLKARDIIVQTFLAES